MLNIGEQQELYLQFTGVGLVAWSPHKLWVFWNWPQKVEQLNWCYIREKIRSNKYMQFITLLNPLKLKFQQFSIWENCWRICQLFIKRTFTLLFIIIKDHYIDTGAKSCHYFSGKLIHIIFGGRRVNWGLISLESSCFALPKLCQPNSEKGKTKPKHVNPSNLPKNKKRWQFANGMIDFAFQTWRLLIK